MFKSLSIDVIDQHTKTDAAFDTLRIQIGNLEATTAPTPPTWVTDIFDAIGNGSIIDEDLVFRVVACFRLGDGTRGAWVSVWQFLRRHEGKLVRVTLESEYPYLNDGGAWVPACLPTDGEDDSYLLPLWTSRQTLYFLFGVWATSGATIALLLLLRQHGFLAIR